MKMTVRNLKLNLPSSLDTFPCPIDNQNFEEYYDLKQVCKHECIYCMYTVAVASHWPHIYVSPCKCISGQLAAEECVQYVGSINQIQESGSNQRTVQLLRKELSWMRSKCTFLLLVNIVKDILFSS